jgi:hypothetical protein
MVTTVSGFTVGETVYLASGKKTPMTIVRFWTDDPPCTHAQVRYAYPYRINGSGYRHMNILIRNLRHENQVGVCDTCHKETRNLVPTTGDCMRCTLRHDRHTNAVEMWGRGRRGY